MSIGSCAVSAVEQGDLKVLPGIMPKHRYLIMALLACSILLPGIPVTEQLQVRPEEMIVLALMPAILARLRWRWTRIDLCFALLGASTVISMAWGVLGQGIPFELRDLMELVKLVKYWIFFRLALYRWSERDRHSILRWVIGCMAVAALIGILQRVNWLGLGAFTRALYGRGSVHALKGRVIGTMRNPNDFAVLLCTALALTVSAWRWWRPRVILVLLAGLHLAAILLTLSRSGLLAAALAVMGAGALQVAWRKRLPSLRWLKGVGIALLAVVLVAFVAGSVLLGELRAVGQMSRTEVLVYVQQSRLHYLIYRFSMPVLESGVSARLKLWQEHWEIFVQSPWFGWGPGKASHATIVDNEYLLYLRRYGMIGLACLLLLYLQIFRAGMRLRRLCPRASVTRGVGLSLVAILSANLAASLFTITFYQLQLMSLFWLLVGIGYSALYFRVEKRGVPSCGISTEGAVMTRDRGCIGAHSHHST